MLFEKDSWNFKTDLCWRQDSFDGAFLWKIDIGGCSKSHVLCDSTDRLKVRLRIASIII